MVGAPLVQSFERKIDKLFQNHPIKLDYTALPLSWKPADACTDDKRESWHKRQHSLIARRRPVRTCTFNIIVVQQDGAGVWRCVIVWGISLAVLAASTAALHRYEREHLLKFLDSMHKDYRPNFASENVFFRHQLYSTYF